jgi:DNA-binding HxlR family transcriptional regulator
MGRFAEPAMWIIVALGAGPAGSSGLFDAVRTLDGPVGPATLLGALARLERGELVERTTGAGRPMYRLTNYARGAPS